MLSSDLDLSNPPQTVIRAFADFGLVVTLREIQSPPFSSNYYVAPHNGVPYCFNTPDLAARGVNAVKHDLLHRNLIIQHHHDLVAAIYNHCSLRHSNVQVMIGGGCQVQVFFGLPGRYMAILYLGLDDAYPLPPQQEFAIIVQHTDFLPLFTSTTFAHTRCSLYGVPMSPASITPPPSIAPKLTWAQKTFMKHS